MVLVRNQKSSISHIRHKNCNELWNLFEKIFISKVYRLCDKPTFGCLPNGGRTQTSWVQCFIEAGPVNFNFIEKEKFMSPKSLTTISLTILALLALFIVNPAIAEVKKEGADKSNKTVASIEKININQADAKALTTLKGIGKDRAVKIVEYREKNGPFKKIEDLMKVKGIGKKLFEKNKHLLSI